jgi:cytochrome c553
LPEVPSLGAQSAPYTLIQLYLFREKQRASEIMNDAAKGLSDDDLRNVADFVGKLPAPQPVDGGDAVRLERGRALLGLYHCNACHRADLSGQQSVPRIAAQREDYLLKTLSEYKSRVRIGYDATMAEALSLPMRLPISLILLRVNPRAEALRTRTDMDSLRSTTFRNEGFAGWEFATPGSGVPRRIPA